MTAQNFEVIGRKIHDTKDAIRGNDIYYQCGICNAIIPSVPDDNINCPCANISIDKDLNRMFVKDFSKFTTLQKKKPSSILSSCGRTLYYFGLISALFILVWLWPNLISSLSWIIILLILGIIIIPIIQRNYRLYKLGKYSPSVFMRKTGVDAVGILLTGVIAIVLAGASARFIGTLVGNAVEKSMPGLGVPAGIFSGITAAVLVGICVGYIARMIWSPITNLIMRSQPSDHRNQAGTG
jgi:hypothetical protein